MATDSADRIVVYPTRGKMVLLALGCVAFLLLTWWLTTIEPDNPMQRMKLWFAIGVGTPFWTFGLCYALRQLIWPQPALEADAQGVSLSGSTHIDWDEIAGVELCDFHKGHISVVLDLIDQPAVIARLSLPFRLMARANVALTGYAFHVPESTLPMSATTLRARVLELRARYGPQADQKGIGLSSR
jgi:hypothetical protein